MCCCCCCWLQADLAAEQSAADSLDAKWGGFSEQERHIEGLLPAAVTDTAAGSVTAAGDAAADDTNEQEKHVEGLLPVAAADAAA
jgi:hypothetical protein